MRSCCPAMKAPATAATEETEVSHSQQVPILNVTGSTVTLDTTGVPPGTKIVVSYTGNVFQSFLRVRKYLGTPTDAADAVLMAASAGRWTAAHRGRGRPHVIITGIYDEAIWASIDPTQISAVIRGKKVLDPRTGITAWSRNAGLQQRDYITSSLGFGIPADGVSDADLIATSNVSDETIDLATQPCSSGRIP